MLFVYMVIFFCVNAEKVRCWMLAKMVDEHYRTERQEEEEENKVEWGRKREKNRLCLKRTLTACGFSPQGTLAGRIGSVD